MAHRRCAGGVLRWLARSVCERCVRVRYLRAHLDTQVRTGFVGAALLLLSVAASAVLLLLFI